MSLQKVWLIFWGGSYDRGSEQFEYDSSQFGSIHLTYEGAVKEVVEIAADFQWTLPAFHKTQSEVHTQWKLHDKWIQILRETIKP